MKHNNNNYNGQSQDDFEAEMRPIALQFEALIDADESAFFDEEALESLFDYYSQQNKWQRAEQVADFAIKNNPSSGEFYLRKAQASLALEKPNLAFEYLEKAELYEPSNYEIYLLRGATHDFLGDRKKAADNFDVALTHADTEGTGIIFAAMGTIYIAHDELDIARKLLKKSLRINPDNHEALNELSYIYHQNVNTLQEGIGFFEKLTDESPRNELIWFCLATLYKHNDDTDKAIDAFDFSIVINDQEDQVYYFKGNTYLDMEQPDKALPCFEKALSLDALNYMYHCSVGVCHEKMEKPLIARKYYNATTELAPNEPDGWFGLAVCALMTDDYDNAIEYLQKAIAIDDTNPDFWYNLGDAYYQTEDTLQSVEAFTKALVLDPKYMEARIDLGFVLSEVEEYMIAISVFEAGMEFHDQNSEYLYCYTALLIEAGKVQQGYEHLQTALAMDYEQHKILFEIAPEILLNAEVINMIERYKK